MPESGVSILPDFNFFFLRDMPPVPLASGTGDRDNYREKKKHPTSTLSTEKGNYDPKHIVRVIKLP